MSVALATKGIIGAQGAGNIATQLAAIQTDVTFIKNIEGGRWKIIADQMVFYKADNLTEVCRFNLYDSAGNPTMTNVYERQRV